MSIIESYHLLSCTIIALNVGAGCSSQSLASLVVEISSSRSYFNFQFGGADVLSRLLLVNAVLSLENFVDPHHRVVENPGLLSCAPDA
jgi:hypothetical protein